MDKIQKIEILAETISKRRKLEHDERILSQPDVTGKEMAMLIYQWCSDYLDEHYDFTPIEKRRHIVFVLLAFTCPRALAGERVSRGLRQMLSKDIFKGLGRVIISIDTPKVAFAFKYYRTFREVCTELITLVEKKLIHLGEKM